LVFPSASINSPFPLPNKFSLLPRVSFRHLIPLPVLFELNVPSRLLILRHHMPILDTLFPYARSVSFPSFSLRNCDFDPISLFLPTQLRREFSPFYSHLLPRTFFLPYLRLLYSKIWELFTRLSTVGTTSNSGSHPCSGFSPCLRPPTTFQNSCSMNMRDPSYRGMMHQPTIKVPFRPVMMHHRVSFFYSFRTILFLLGHFPRPPTK